MSERKHGDLISREALLKNAQRMTEYDEAGWGVPVRVVKVEHIENAPAVDAVEVVHGRWKTNWCDNNLIGHEYEECSNCGCSMVDTNQFWKSNFCPNCGARMDGERKE